MWSADAPPPEPLRQISVFDSEAAAVYLGEKTDTAFRPAGLEVFDLLAQACDAAKRLLEAELASEKAFSLPSLPSGTEAGDLVQRLSGMTEDRVVERLASLDETQRARLATLGETLAVPQGESGAAARAARLQAKRIRSLLATIDEAHSLLNTERLKALHALFMSVRDAERDASQLQEVALGSCIPGTGGERWRRLWAAAADFSREPFPSSTFPSTERCLLCQQELSEEARTRLTKLAEYMASEARAKSARSREQLQKDRAAITSRQFAAERAVELDDLRLSSPELTFSVERYFASAESLRTKVSDEELIAEQIGLPAFELRQELALLAASFDDKARATEAARSAEERGKLEREFKELAARAELARSKEVVFAELRRIRRRLAIEQCIKDTSTAAITKKSGELTQAMVTSTLVGAFAKRLERIGARRMAVGVKAAGGRQGVLYHQLGIEGVQRVELPKVVSEGEGRCLSLAAFLAELDVTESKSTLVFDDPVSSLDHKWRDSLARTLAEEAALRQVIVFTHDVVFLLALEAQASKLGVALAKTSLRIGATGCGTTSTDVPWIAMKVSDRVGKLRNLHQTAAALYRAEGVDSYEPHATRIYGLLRESWERAVEEVLLNGVVERFRVGIETKPLRHLSDIQDADYQQLEAAMTKCSTWLPGHDQAPARNASLPLPEELLADINALDSWSKSIRARREKRK